MFLGAVDNNTIFLGVAKADTKSSVVVNGVVTVFVVNDAHRVPTTLKR